MAEEEVTLLAEARAKANVIEIDISNLHRYYETRSQNVSKLFWEMTQNLLFEFALAEERFNKIVRDCQIFVNELCTTISGLRNDAESKHNTHTKCANRLNNNLFLL
jgi:hypothetical protein